MYKIIGADQKEYGPVSADQIRQWIQENRSNGQTRVLPEGATAWVELGSLPEFANALAAKTGQPALPPLAPFATAGTETTEILNRQVSLDLGGCLSRSWSLVRNNFPLLLGVNLIAMVITVVAVGIASGVGTFIPFLPGLVLMSFLAVLDAGVVWVLLRLARGESAAVGDLFAGFQRSFGHLLLAGLISGVLLSIGTCCCILPGLCLYVLWIFMLPIIIDLRMEAWAAMELSRKVAWKNWWSLVALIIVIGLIQLVIPAICGLVSMATLGTVISPIITELIAKLPSTVETPADAVPMMVSIFTFMFGFAVGKLLNMLIVTPFSTGAVVYAYEDLFGKNSRPAN